MTDPVHRQGDPGPVAEFDAERAERAVRELLIAIGEDPDREGLRETPARVARAYRELYAGLRQRPEDVLTTTFDLGHDEMVLVRDIELPARRRDKSPRRAKARCGLKGIAACLRKVCVR